MIRPDIALFDHVIEFPDTDADRLYERLIGLDEFKARLLKEGSLILDRGQLEHWSQRHYQKGVPLLQVFHDRVPLFVFAGDVGTGKTALAKSFGSAIARESNISVTLYSLSLNARGTGAVGEMTTLISAAFERVRTPPSSARPTPGLKGTAKSARILLIDEADTLAQSREFAQMHHEDRAGVNALIRGIDDLATKEVPVLVVMCTNRLTAIDPAVLRRAAGVFNFDRPDEQQRFLVLQAALDGVGLSQEELRRLSEATGASNGREYGYTFSDLTNRYLPSVLLEAFPDTPIKFIQAMDLATRLAPTPPFNGPQS